MLGTNGTPDDRGVVEGLDVVARKVVRSIGCANVGNGTHGPLYNSKLAKTGPDSGDKLCGKERPLRYVHVVTEL